MGVSSIKPARGIMGYESTHPASQSRNSPLRVELKQASKLSLANSTDQDPACLTEPPSQPLITNFRSCVWGVGISYLRDFQQQPTNWVGEVRPLQDRLYENAREIRR